MTLQMWFYVRRDTYETLRGGKILPLTFLWLLGFWLQNALRKSLSYENGWFFSTLQLSFYYPQETKLISLLNSYLIHSVCTASKNLLPRLKQTWLFVAFLPILFGTSLKQSIYIGIGWCQAVQKKALSKITSQKAAHCCVAGIIIFLHYVKCLYFDCVSKVNILLETRNAF